MLKQDYSYSQTRKRSSLRMLVQCNNRPSSTRNPCAYCCYRKLQIIDVYYTPKSIKSRCSTSLWLLLIPFIYFWFYIIVIHHKPRGEVSYLLASFDAVVTQLFGQLLHSVVNVPSVA